MDEPNEDTPQRRRSDRFNRHLSNAASASGIVLALLATWNDMQTDLVTHTNQLKYQQQLITNNTQQLKALRTELREELRQATNDLQSRIDRDRYTPPRRRYGAPDPEHP